MKRGLSVPRLVSSPSVAPAGLSVARLNLMHSQVWQGTPPPPYSLYVAPLLRRLRRADMESGKKKKKNIFKSILKFNSRGRACERVGGRECFRGGRGQREWECHRGAEGERVKERCVKLDKVRWGRAFHIRGNGQRCPPPSCSLCTGLPHSCVCACTCVCV